MTKATISSDFSDLVAAFDAEAVEYLVVGGYAVGAHARPRATKDLDLWIAGGENLERVARALARFGLPAPFVEAARSLGDDEVLFFGAPPLRVDLLRSLSGVSFADARSRAVRMPFGPHEGVPFIGLDDLITNKRATGRPRDLADAEALERAPVRLDDHDSLVDRGVAAERPSAPPVLSSVARVWAAFPPLELAPAVVGRAGPRERAASRREGGVIGPQSAVRMSRGRRQMRVSQGGCRRE